MILTRPRRFSGSRMPAVPSSRSRPTSVPLMLVLAAGLGLLRSPLLAQVPFAAAVNYANNSAPPSFIAAGLVNGDTLVDFVTGSTGTSSFTVWLNNPANPGTYSLAPAMPVAGIGGGGVVGVGILDANGDGLSDIVVARSNGVGFYVQSPAGAFTGPLGTFYWSNVSLNSLATADLDGNGLRDVVLTRGTGIRVLRQTTPGVFTDLGDTPSGGGTQLLGLLIADTCPVGIGPEIIANTSTTLYTFQSTLGSAVYAFGSSTPTGLNQVCCYDAADLNGDNAIDLVVGSTNANASNLVRPFVNSQACGFNQQPDIAPVGGYANLPALADFDGDLDVDLAVLNGQFNTVFFRWASGLPCGTAGCIPGYAPLFSTAAGPGAIAMIRADVDNDGDVDLVTANSGGTGPAGISVLRNLAPPPLPCAGGLRLAITHGACANPIVVQNRCGVPGQSYFTVLTFNPQNAGGGLGSGFWFGLHTDMAELLGQFSFAQPPFVGTLGTGGSSTLTIPAGSFPPSICGTWVYGVTVTFAPSPPFTTVTGVSPVVATLL